MATNGRYYYKTTTNPIDPTTTFATPIYQIDTFQPATMATGHQQMYQFANCHTVAFEQPQQNTATTATYTTNVTPSVRQIFQTPHTLTTSPEKLNFVQELEQLKLILTDQIPPPPLPGNGSSMITPPLSPHNDQMIYYHQQPQQQQQQLPHSTTPPQTATVLQPQQILVQQQQQPQQPQQQLQQPKTEFFSIKYRSRKRSLPKMELQQQQQQQQQIPAEYIIETPQFSIKQESQEVAQAEPMMKKCKKSLRNGKAKRKSSQTISSIKLNDEIKDFAEMPMKNSQKRTAHLSAEFRYRTKLNEKICKLRSLVGQRVHLSKSAVLTKSIERIVKLQKLALRLHESNSRLMFLLSKYVLDPVDRRALEQQASLGLMAPSSNAQQQQQPTKLMSIKELTKSLSSNQQQQQQQPQSQQLHHQVRTQPQLTSSTASSPVSSHGSLASPCTFGLTSLPDEVGTLISEPEYSSSSAASVEDMFDVDRLLDDSCLLSDLDAVLFNNGANQSDSVGCLSNNASTVTTNNLIASQSSGVDDDDHFDLESLLAQF